MTIDGQVIEIGAEGNLVTNISHDQLDGAPRDETLAVKFAGHETFGLFENDHDQPPSTMVAKIGTQGQLEIEIVGMSLSEMLGIRVGDSVSVNW